MSKIKICVSFLILINLVQCDLFTSLERISKLTKSLGNAINSLKRYIDEKDRKINFMKRYLKTFEIEYDKATKDPEKYVENPLKAFTIVKRLSRDILSLNNIAEEKTELTWDEESLYPTVKDCEGAAMGIYRLQNYYNLNTEHLAEGKIIDYINQKVIAETDPMTLSDCFEMGNFSYHMKDFKRSAEWLTAALNKSDTDPVHKNISADILEDLVLLHHIMNSTLDATAYELAKKLFAIDPDINTGDPTRYLYYFKQAYDKEHEVEDVQERIDQENLHKLCSGETKISTTKSSKLFCSYLKRTPLLKLAPMKMEQLHINPDILLFHDVIYDGEIEALKEAAKPQLTRARVVNATSGAVNYAEGRICQRAFLGQKDHSVVSRISWRSHIMTGLSLEYAESLQVLNYGIGGYNGVHYDYFRNLTQANLEKDGNRVATLLFYMTDVEYGGATAFPELNVSVKPKKGNALFWRNLLSSGEFDTRTKHAACPVLYGNKWLATLWFHEGGQSLIDPCPLVRETFN